ILEVRHLTTSFSTPEGRIHAVDDVSFNAYAGRTLGIVGESGCGKSVTCLSVMRLIPNKVVQGEILYNGQDLLQLDSKEMRLIRGNEIAMVFQEPMTALNPVLSIGDQLSEGIVLHRKISKRQARDEVIELLKWVKIQFPEKRIHDFPHQLSGGMRQRVLIAMALSCSPQILIADEPTAALDVTIQAQILDLFKELQEKLGMALILITHDLGVVAEIADEVMVMYAGRLVEQGSVEDLFQRPQMPYTRALLKSTPLNHARGRLEAIPGI
ncbi:unnamed protein product, partial [Sphagnum jensenii]